MGIEDIELRLRDGTRGPVKADIRRYGATVRALRALVVGAAGIVLGAVLIVVPVLHLITTWLLPLLGLIGAWYVYRIPLVIGRVEGACPACGEALDVKGGPQAEDLWIRCPSCSAPFQFEVSESV